MKFSHIRFMQFDFSSYNCNNTNRVVAPTHLITWLRRSSVAQADQSVDSLKGGMRDKAYSRSNTALKRVVFSKI